MTGVSIYIQVTTRSFFLKVNIWTEIKQEFKEEHISQLKNFTLKLFYWWFLLKVFASVNVCFGKLTNKCSLRLVEDWECHLRLFVYWRD